MARLAIKWVPVDVCSHFQAIIDGTADLECGSSPVSLSRMRIVDFYNIVFADSTGVLVKANAGIINFESMAGKKSPSCRVPRTCRRFRIS